MSIRRAATALALTGACALALPACGSGGGSSHAAATPSHRPASAAAAPPEVAPSGSTHDESSVTKSGGTTHAYHDRVTLHLASVTRLDRADTTDTSALQTPVKVTVTITGGSADVPVDAAGQWMTVLYGKARTEAPQEPGRATKDPKHQAVSTHPTRIAKGAHLTVFETFDVPTADVGTIAVQVDVPIPTSAKNHYAPWIFTNANTMLH